jgi:hypothetical protein
MKSAMFFTNSGTTGALAQLGERMTGSHEVRGSIPLGSTPPQLDCGTRQIIFPKGKMIESGKYFQRQLDSFLTAFFLVLNGWRKWIHSSSGSPLSRKREDLGCV